MKWLHLKENRHLICTHHNLYNQRRFSWQIQEIQQISQHQKKQNTIINKTEYIKNKNKKIYFPIQKCMGNIHKILKTKKLTFYHFLNDKVIQNIKK